MKLTGISFGHHIQNSQDIKPQTTGFKANSDKIKCDTVNFSFKGNNDPSQELLDYLKSTDPLEQRIDAVLKYLKGGADPNFRDKDGVTPLCWAGDKLIAEILVENGADIDNQDKYGNTPLHWFISSNNAYISNGIINENEEKLAKNTEKIIEFLMLSGANGDIKNNDGRTPYEIPYRNGSTDMLYF
ncbi:MAG: hypothetical protein A2104_01940 [Candidatus Melainabacteria bacterium GWF2_32_7]|nr:MAG: hypothetical protein A2104_01940 [Candidatus Melainabacteria bacterium GWF2_32_7]